MRQVLDKQFRPFRSRMRIAMELPSVGMIKVFVAAGLGVSLISESFAQRRSAHRSGETDSDFGYGSVARAGAGLPARSHASRVRPPLLSRWFARACKLGAIPSPECR